MHTGPGVVSLLAATALIGALCTGQGGLGGVRCIMGGLHLCCICGPACAMQHAHTLDRVQVAVRQLSRRGMQGAWCTARGAAEQP